MKKAFTLTFLLAASTALAQESSSFRIKSSVLNLGGHPAEGSVPSSAGYRITLGALGDAVSPTAMAGASYGIEGGLTSAFPSPGEISGLRFSSPTSFFWTAESSPGVHKVYRGLTADLPSLGYGACDQDGISGETATDTAVPPTGEAYFYLVTKVNCLGEEGTKGFDSDDDERGNPSSCP